MRHAYADAGEIIVLANWSAARHQVGAREPCGELDVRHAARQSGRRPVGRLVPEKCEKLGARGRLPSVAQLELDALDAQAFRVALTVDPATGRRSSRVGRRRTVLEGRVSVLAGGSGASAFGEQTA